MHSNHPDRSRGSATQKELRWTDSVMVLTSIENLSSIEPSDVNIWIELKLMISLSFAEQRCSAVDKLNPAGQSALHPQVVLFCSHLCNQAAHIFVHTY